MRVAIVAESFLPQVNGVVNSVLRVLEHLRAQGHDALVIAPKARPGEVEVSHYQGFRVVRVASVDLPLINSLPIGVPQPAVLAELRLFRPDVVHCASPFVLGAAGALAAKALGIPCVAVYQTDVAGFAGQYHLRALQRAAWKWTRRLHNQCALTLAPSSMAIADLELHGVRRVRHWGRGVSEVFHPGQRDEELRQQWGAGAGKLVVGFVGRLAAEKSVGRLRALIGREDIQLVIVGDGPERERLERELPGAVFTGALFGDALARAYASFDVFVHTGEFETFCQTLQEAQASGVPTIAPAAGGPLDLVKPAVNGWLLDVDVFERDLPAAVERIRADLSGYAARARASVEGKTWRKRCEQLMGYYLEAIELQQVTPSVHRYFAPMLAAG